MTTVSVILPVHNEAATVGKVLSQLVAKRIPNVKLEIIVVHSFSTDGTALVLEKFRGLVQLFTQAEARGKGNAVREGLRHATGSIIIIQDADLEYSINDYEKLLDPILRGRTNFVLGSRHSDQGVVRQFASSPTKAALMNFGHRLFAFALNKLFGGSMQDPFTMFKVFSAECIRGAEFRCNRFDFDFELVITLLKRGYQPIEIPVSYSSRCFQAGKKVRLWRDPPTWVWVMVRMWLSRSPKLPRCLCHRCCNQTFDRAAFYRLINRRGNAVLKCDRCGTQFKMEWIPG